MPAIAMDHLMHPDPSALVASSYTLAIANVGLGRESASYQIGLTK
jgi:hypothetical protein